MCCTNLCPLLLLQLKEVVVLMLLSQGNAQVSARNNAGESPIQLAKKGGSKYLNLQRILESAPDLQSG